MERGSGRGARGGGGPAVTLREVDRSRDVPVFYEQQRDEQACRVAGYPMRGWEAFVAHWEANALGDPDVVVRAIEVRAGGGAAEVAGYVSCFVRAGRRQVGCWLGRAWRGRGIASRALGMFLEEVIERPLHAYVAKHNAGAIRVLERNGFRRIDEGVIPDSESGTGEAVEEWLYELG